MGTNSIVHILEDLCAEVVVMGSIDGLSVVVLGIGVMLDDSAEVVEASVACFDACIPTFSVSFESCMGNVNTLIIIKHRSMIRNMSIAQKLFSIFLDMSFLKDVIDLTKDSLHLIVIFYSDFL